MDIRAYRFDGYIRNIATVKDYFEHSMELLQKEVREELFSRDIAERLKKGYDFLLPYYRYFVTLDGDADPRDAE